jgi:hypothetical protein
MAMHEAQRQLRQESEALLDKLQASDRVRARLRLKTAGPHALSDYERRLLGVEYQAERRHKPLPLPPQAPSPRELVVKELCPHGITFRTPLLQQLNDHAVMLAVQHGITVKRTRDGHGWAHQEARVIHAPAVTNEETYAVCLHEMGHIVSPAGDSRQYTYVIKSHGDHASLVAPAGEVGAWRWAVDNAVVWTREMQQRLYESLKSYAYSATEDERNQMCSCLISACGRMVGRAWGTFAELDAKCADLRGCP